MKYVFIEPHPDDIAFSCGGMVATLSSGITKTVLTVFGRSCWTASTGCRPALWQHISKIRRRETISFATLAGFDHISFDLPDSSLRGYTEEKRYASDPMADPLLDSLVGRIGDIF